MSVHTGNHKNAGCQVSKFLGTSILKANIKVYYDQAQGFIQVNSIEIHLLKLKDSSIVTADGQSIIIDK